MDGKENFLSKNKLYKGTQFIDFISFLPISKARKQEDKHLFII